MQWEQVKVNTTNIIASNSPLYFAKNYILFIFLTGIHIWHGSVVCPKVSGKV